MGSEQKLETAQEMPATRNMAVGVGGHTCAWEIFKAPHAVNIAVTVVVQTTA